MGQDLSAQPGADLDAIDDDGNGEIHQTGVAGVHIRFPCLHRHLAALDVVSGALRGTFFRGAHQTETKGAEFIEGLLFDRGSIEFDDQIGEARHFIEKILELAQGFRVQHLRHFDGTIGPFCFGAFFRRHAQTLSVHDRWFGFLLVPFLHEGLGVI